MLSAIKAGASGYLLKASAAEDIRRAIGEVARGGSFLSSAVARKVLAEFQESAKPAPDDRSLQGLTERERAIMDRLDKVCGVENWMNQFKEFKSGLLCGISIRIDGEWITKWDGAQETQIEPFKGGLSDSMKRAAVQWKIGRYLYKEKDHYATIVDRSQKQLNHSKRRRCFDEASKAHGQFVFVDVRDVNGAKSSLLRIHISQ